MSRRENVPYNPYYFEERAREGESFSREDTFRMILERHFWGKQHPISGAGADRNQTRIIERELPRLLRACDVKALLDLPCGDYGWMEFVDLTGIRYIGADILPELIEVNRARHGDERHEFTVLDMVRDPLPPADLMLCRDCLVHMSFPDILLALENIRRSGIRYLLTTTFPDHPENEDIVTGDWRLLNLRKAPFDFPEPLELINEGCSEGGGIYRDKCLGLWRVEDLSGRA